MSFFEIINGRNMREDFEICERIWILFWLLWELGEGVEGTEYFFRSVFRKVRVKLLERWSDWI